MAKVEIPVCPAALLVQLQDCLRADGTKVPARLMSVMAALVQYVGRIEQTDLAWIEARQLLATIGRGVLQTQPRWTVSIDSDGEQAPWGGLWLGVVTGAWQLWHRTPQQGWQCVYGQAQSLPAADAPGFFLTTSAALHTDQVAQSSYWQWVLALLKGRIGSIMLASVIINLGLLSLPLFAMLVYDKVVFNGVFETLWALAIGVALALALEIAVRALRARQVERLSMALDERIDSRLFSMLLRPSVQAGSQPGMAARFLTLYRDLAGARDFFSAQYLLAVADLPFVLMLWLVICVIAWPLFLVVFVWTALYAWLGGVLKTRMLRAGQSVVKAQVAKQAVLTDAMSSLDLLRTSQVGGKMFGRFMQLAREQSLHTALQREEANRSLWLTQIIYAGSYVSLLVAGAYLVFHQELTTGALIAVSMLSGRSLGVIGQALATLGRWQELHQALRSLAPFLEAKEEAKAVVASRTHASIDGRILVHRVSHVYPGMSACLQELNFSVAAGERVALMGRPGSGKSTLARVLAGAIVPSAGEVRLDDIGLMSHDAGERSLWMAFKPQEVALMAGSLEENILAGVPSWMSQEQRDHALRRGVYFSGLDQDLAAGTLSLDRMIEEYGVNLSGGQRQKVALARALALEVRILILDEPSNGLDTESERLLVRRLAELKNVTLILITHSAMLLGLSQRVIALDRGRLMADGLTRELVKPAA